MVSEPRLIYVSHFLSAWGDRMWSFAVALFLMDLASENLILPAAFGLTLAASVLMFGPVVGNWIDRSPRLYAARMSLVIQNSSVAICAIILLLQKLWMKDQSGFLIFVKISSIILGAIARLASTASLIVIQKDWIVVIAGGNSDLLSELNSVVRRIDLFTKLLAPLICGQVMTLASLAVGCAFVAGWNIVSMFVEYVLLQIVYKRTPALANKGKAEKDDMLLEQDDAEARELKDLGEERKKDRVEEEDPDLQVEVKTQPEGDAASKPDKNHTSIWRTIFGFVLVIPKGWKLYMSQKIMLAGIGMSCLYMTVLGFDAITISYAYNQCFSELLVGLLLGASAITGILATFVFAPLKSRFGLVRTGLLASYAHLLTLIPCIASVFAPGSPFFLLPHDTPPTAATPTYTYATSNETITPNMNATAPSGDGIFLKCIDGIAPPASYWSLSLLMAGAILARVGLWGYDLVVTQLFQEHVAEKERGVVSGVQSSLNYLMDLTHFVLVLALPQPDQFGILVLLSALFVSIGYFLYGLFAVKQTGKFLVCQ